MSGGKDAEGNDKALPRLLIDFTDTAILCESGVFKQFITGIWKMKDTEIEKRMHIPVRDVSIIGSVLHIIGKSADKILQGIIIAMLAAMTVSIVLQVFCRYVLNSPLVWPEEVARMLMIWSIFLASYYALIEGGHIGLEYVKQRVPFGLRRVFDFISYLLMLGFLLIMTVKGVESCIAVSNEYTPVLMISTAIPYASMPVSGFLMLIVVVKLLYRNIRGK